KSSTIQWTWPSFSTHEASSTSAKTSTIHWTWPSLSTHEAFSSPTTITTTRRPLGLTTWSSDLFDYQIGDEV
ncbi:unnamed protein product, partial [Rotaria sp. Silwood1]